MFPIDSLVRAGDELLLFFLVADMHRLPASIHSGLLRWQRIRRTVAKCEILKVFELEIFDSKRMEGEREREVHIVLREMKCNPIISIRANRQILAQLILNKYSEYLEIMRYVFHSSVIV